MITRVLPSREWSRLAGTDLGSVLPQCSSDTTLVLVVEDGDRIVGCWAALTVIHAEGVWIAPEHRGKSSVARRLWAGMRKMLHGKVSAVLTGAADESIRALIEGHGGVPVPPLYRLPLENVCPQP